MNEFSAIAMFFKEGGSFMWFMLATAVVAVAISAERFIVISRASGWNSTRMVDDIARAVKQGDWNAAGHMTITKLAWDQLDAKDRATLIELLKEHPHWEKFFLAAGKAKDVPDADVQFALRLTVVR